ncbi:MAG TPA: SRPBCC family protein [Microbacterium sp.]|nr:SRPBCC family protein [Microbacterium sp.]
MATNVRTLACTPEDVFRVLANGWLYPAWVVGASRMREVEGEWPQQGAKLHHSVGTWPLLIDDTTSMVEWKPPHRAVMQARGWPIGEARVTIEVRAEGDGCAVRIRERAVSGPAAIVPRILIDPLLRWRNSETLRRLAYLAESSSL